MSRKWKIRHTSDEATQEVASLYANQDVKDEIQRIMYLLANEEDPRKPKSSSLIVHAIEHDAPGWFRVKVPRYAVRIIFTLLLAEGDKVRELRPDEVPPEDVERFIDITRAGRHPGVYGKGLRERYKKLRGGDA